MEDIILGTLLLHGRGMEEVDLKPSDFSGSNSLLFSIIRDLAERDMPYDLASVVAEVKSRKLEDRLPVKRLTDLTLQATIPELLSHYSRRLREVRAKEAFCNAIAEAHELATRGADVAQIVEKLEEAMGWAEGGEEGVVPVTLAEALRSWDEWRKKGVGRFKVPYPYLSDWVRGLSPGEYVIVGGRPGTGKTSLLLNLAAHWSVKLGHKGLFVSLETQPEILVERLLSHLAALPAWDVREDRAPSNLVESARSLLSRGALEVVSHGGLTVRDLRRLLRRRPYEVVYLDYVQLMHAPGASSRYDEVSRISRGLKVLAMQEEVLIVCAAQLSRYAERKGGEPGLADLRDSSALESDADHVWILYPSGITGRVALKVAKNRHGPLGALSFAFNGETYSFLDPQPTGTEPKEEDLVPF